MTSYKEVDVALDIIGVAQAPIFLALVLCSFCLLALWIYPVTSKATPQRTNASVRKKARTLERSEQTDDIAYCSLSGVMATLVILTWTRSIILTAPFTLFTIVITWNFRKKRRKRDENRMLEVWPEVTDHLISALHSGVSLSEALAGLSLRGPIQVRPDFLIFKTELRRTGDFSAAAETLKKRFNSHGSDQILEAILLAKSLGGSELLQIFRTLGEFLRQDLAVRKEIEVKHGWIRNSAHLSSAAPWLLLLLLSSQPGTARAFSQPTGVLILSAGLVLTAVAYLWMGRLGQLPSAPRVFSRSMTI